MKNIYYKIWVDTIVSINKKPQRKNDWKFYSMFFMTILTALNLITIIMWLGYLGIKTLYIKIDVFPGDILDSFASFIIEFALPCFFVNYFLIFFKNRYKKLTEKYGDRKGKFFLAYLFCSIAIFIIPVLFYWWMHK